MFFLKENRFNLTKNMDQLHFSYGHFLYVRNKIYMVTFYTVHFYTHTFYLVKIYTFTFYTVTKFMQ